MDWFIAHCDGGSRGNPGPAGFGAVIEFNGNTVARLSQFLGIRTNNFAEYSGLVAVLKFAIENGYKNLRVVSDSQVMVQQMKRVYKINSPSLKPLWAEASALTARLVGFEIVHTLRDGNKDADRLANAAMDRGGPEGGESSVVQHHELQPLTPAQAEDMVNKVKAAANGTEIRPSQNIDVKPDFDGIDTKAGCEDEQPVFALPKAVATGWKVVEVTKFGIVDNQGNTIATADTQEAADTIVGALRVKSAF